MTAVAQPAVRNGVDTAALFSTLDAVKQQPEIATFRFSASNTWVSGTHSQTTISGFYGAMQEMEHKSPTVLDADHPTVLVGRRQRPHPRRVPAARPRRLPHRRHRQHRRRPEASP